MAVILPQRQFNHATRQGVPVRMPNPHAARNNQSGGLH
jgi:hypothetical protein